MVLTAQPDSNVVISVTSGDTGEATVSAENLTFTTANWDTAQTVTEQVLMTPLQMVLKNYHHYGCSR